MRIKTNGKTIRKQLLLYQRMHLQETKMREILERLSAEGLRVARVTLGDYVSVKEIEHGVSIYTNSQEAVFIEFGAGFGATHPLAYELGFYEGSWSETHSRQFVDKGRWYYKGVRYTRIPAGMGMYDASKYVAAIAERVVREAFND